VVRVYKNVVLFPLFCENRWVEQMECTDCAVEKKEITCHIKPLHKGKSRRFLQVGIIQ